MKLKPVVSVALAMFLAMSNSAEATDFKVKGLWQWGFSVNENALVTRYNGKMFNKPISNDQFKARQRIRLQLDAVASENLSGSVQVEIGHQRWGQASSGAALGADGNVIELRQAYLDWMVPDTDVKVRMGIQNLTLPNAAGGDNVLANRSNAGIVVNWMANENWGLTAMWLRPFNDNYAGWDGQDQNYLDNLDLFFLGVPLRFNEFELTPWVMYGMLGRNTFKVGNQYHDFYYRNWGQDNGNATGGLTSAPFGNLQNIDWGATGKNYGSLFWVGLPIKFRHDAWKFEFEANYGYAEPLGRYDVEKTWYGRPYGIDRASTKREGWILQALAEYKMDWGTPGIFGWYGSGDDGSLKNGSERMPFIYAETKFTSILGDATALYGGVGGNDRSMSFSGSWGVGLQIKDISFIPKLKHLIRAAWIGGTNSPDMVKYADYLTRNVSNDGPSIAWQQGIINTNDYYLTSKDNLLEFNLHNIYQMYQNLSVGLELGYVVNMIDKDQWKKAANTTYSKTDMWLVDVMFRYSF